MIHWQGIEDQTVETMEVSYESGQIRIHSRIEGVVETIPVKLRYDLILNPDWTWREFRLRNAENDIYHLFADEADSPVRRYIDFCLTPATNTLPIRKEALAVGEKVTIEVLYVCFPAQKPEAIRQEYERIDERTYRFRQPSTDFEAWIEVDAEGFVTNYEGLFRRL